MRYCFYQVVPWGLRKLLQWLKETYNDPEIIITENGYCDRGETDDDVRVNYYKVKVRLMLSTA